MNPQTVNPQPVNQNTEASGFDTFLDDFFTDDKLKQPQKAKGKESPGIVYNFNIAKGSSPVFYLYPPK